MRTSNSDYIWNTSGNVLLIQDLDQGRMSVTNDIENVLSDLQKSIGDSIKSMDIIYRDSNGVWDGVIAEWGVSRCTDARFYHIGETNKDNAIQKINKL